MTTKKTPKEKMVYLLEAYRATIALLKADPSDRKNRDIASAHRSHLKSVCKEFKLVMPELESVPALPDPKPKGGFHKAAGAPVVKSEPLPPKQDESKPYEPPTAKEIMDLLPEQPVFVVKPDALEFTADGRFEPTSVPTKAKDIAAQIMAQIQVEVNHPSHYTHGSVECIDGIRAAIGDEAFVAHCRATAMKYLWRTGKKGPARTDIAKAVWYCQKAAEVLAEIEEKIA